MFEIGDRPHRAIRYAVTREFVGSGMPEHEICYTFNAEQAEEIAETLALGAYNRGATNVQYNVTQTGILFDDAVERQLLTKEYHLHATCDTIHRQDEEYAIDVVWWEEHEPYITGQEDFTKDMQEFHREEYYKENTQ